MLEKIGHRRRTMVTVCQKRRPRVRKLAVIDRFVLENEHTPVPHVGAETVKRLLNVGKRAFQDL